MLPEVQSTGLNGPTVSVKGRGGQLEKKGLRKPLPPGSVNLLLPIATSVTVFQMETYFDFLLGFLSTLFAPNPKSLDVLNKELGICIIKQRGTGSLGFSLRVPGMQYLSDE